MIAEGLALRASKWCYRGLWGIVTRWLLVPSEPPQLTGAGDQMVSYFRPAEGYLRYLKFYFWIGLLAVDIALTIAWFAIFIAAPLVGILITPVALAIIVLPDVVAYVAIHLRYDSTWYALSDRTLRIRRGLFQIHETTITYENIQNVSIRQGPVQRHFGIADVKVETAGGGGSVSGEGVRSIGHSGLLEGVTNAEEIRRLILEKWRNAKTTGLGDDPLSAPHSATTIPTWRPQHIEMLQQIRELAVKLSRPT
jgi:membrane protein YdbS with pleckstrin-like domain